MKLKPRPWFDIVEQVEAIADAVPPSFKLDLDANATWQNAPNAMAVMSKLRDCRGWGNVAVFESPIPQDDIAGNQQIKSVIERPIAMHFGSPPHSTNVRTPVADMYVIGGGATTCMTQGHQAADANIPFWLQLVGPGLTTTVRLQHPFASSSSRLKELLLACFCTVGCAPRVGAGDGGLAGDHLLQHLRPLAPHEAH